MSTLAEIERAIQRLSPEDLEKLRAWMEARCPAMTHRSELDAQIRDYYRNTPEDADDAQWARVTGQRATSAWDEE